MPRDAYRYAFENKSTFDDALATLNLAVIAVESLHGEARARMDAKFANDQACRAIVIDASTPVGQTLNEVFVGYARREFGEAAFRVERVDQLHAHAASAGATG